jgi:glycosyltransferase involved in cell wall biosynthesis
MFSIIIPLYNKETYIQKAIDSILNQGFRQYEIIVVDDGSTDNSYNALLKSGIKKTDHTIIQQKNAGVSTARNSGAKLAKYPYLAFLDADDWWHEDYLSEMADLIKSYPDAGLFSSSYFKVKNNQLYPAKIGVDEDFTTGYINYPQVYAKTFWMPVWTGACVVKKDVFEEFSGFKTQLKLGEDFDLWIRISLRYKLAFVNKNLAFYNQDVMADTRAVVAEKIYEPSTHFIFNLDYLDHFDNQSDVKKLLDILRVYTLLRYRLSRQYPDEVRREIRKVDFSAQKFDVYLQYHLPVVVVKIYFKLMYFISDLKNSIKS